MTTSPTPAGRSEHLPAIEGMRAIAILLVVAYHAGIAVVSGGYVGVDVFFVLSGYLIIGLLERELRETGRVQLIAFWARRARRLLPAAGVVLVATLTATTIILPPHLQRQTAAAALASAAYVSNLWFAWRATDYLGDEAGNPLLHTWSLSVEEQFYVFWPLALAALALVHRGSSRARVALLAGAFVAASFTWAMLQQPVAPSLAFFSPLTRAWEFGLGGLVVLVAHRDAQTGRAPWLAGWIGLLSIVGAAVFFDDGTAMPGVPTLIPVLGTALLLLGMPRVASSALSDPFRWLSTRPMRWIGRVSYSWYLWHWPVGVLLVAAVQVDTTTVWLVGAIVSLVLAEVTRRSIEDPVRFHPVLGGHPRLVLAGAAAVVVVLLVASDRVRARATAMSNSLSAARVAEAQARPVVYTNGCFVTATEVRFPDCVSGDTTSDRLVVLVGDSHAAQWYPALQPIAARAGWRLVAFIKGGCPFAEVVGSGPRAEEESCVAWRTSIRRRIVASKPDLVITASFAHVKWPGDRGGLYLAVDWGAGLRRELARLDAASIPTILLRNPPRPGFDVPACMARLARFQRANPPLCSFDRDAPRIVEVARQEELAARGLDFVTLVDLGETICPRGHCVPVIDDHLVYRDRHHLTAGYAASLTDDLWKILGVAVLRQPTRETRRSRSSSILLPTGR